MPNFGILRKTCQIQKPLLCFELSFPSVHDDWAEEQEWVWSLSIAYTLRKLRTSRCPSFVDHGKFLKSKKKNSQSPKPLLWFELAFPSVHDAWPEEQQWVWVLSMAYTLRKLRNSRCPSFIDHAKFWKSEKKLVKAQSLCFDLNSDAA